MCGLADKGGGGLSVSVSGTTAVLRRLPCRYRYTVTRLPRSADVRRTSWKIQVCLREPSLLKPQLIAVVSE